MKITKWEQLNLFDKETMVNADVSVDVRAWTEELITDIRDSAESISLRSGKDRYVELIELAIEVLDDELNAESIANSVVSET